MVFHPGTRVTGLPDTVAPALAAVPAYPAGTNILKVPALVTVTVLAPRAKAIGEVVAIPVPLLRTGVMCTPVFWASFLSPNLAITSFIFASPFFTG
jgi:hypothetical protein